MTNFITNDSQKNLKKRLVELISESTELKFLVGFFYFSGIAELYESLRENPATTLKVLVGLHADTLNARIVEYEREREKSNREKIDAFLGSLKKALNAKDFDTQALYEQIAFFAAMLREGRLVLRKTKEPNHAKVYIFHFSSKNSPTKIITGSSNLTRPGLSEQNEFNVEIGDYGQEEAIAYFEKLWEDSVELTENEETRRKILNVIEKKTPVREITPFEAFVRILSLYVKSAEGSPVSESTQAVMRKNGYTPYAYQLDAISQAKAILEKHNGVILADVVGLGKSVIASALAREIGGSGIILCPPGLVGEKNAPTFWWKYVRDFGLKNWEVVSSGNLEEAQKRAKGWGAQTIIIDEAHRFRNGDNRTYELLHTLCRGKKVILLTATPFNNSPADIFSLLKLFTVPAQSTITWQNNIRALFTGYSGRFHRLTYIKRHRHSHNEMRKAQAQKYLVTLFGNDRAKDSEVEREILGVADEVRAKIEPVTVRRNRLDLKLHPRYREEVKNLSDAQPPQSWFYELAPAQSDFYDRVLTEYFGEDGRFTGAVYQPFLYEEGLETDTENLKGEDNHQYLMQKNLFDFMRRLLVKRFESSFGSFAQSIENFRNLHEKILRVLAKNGERFVLDRTLIEKMEQGDEDEIETILAEYEKKLASGDFSKRQKVYKVKTFKDREKFYKNIQSDIDLFEEIQERMVVLELIAHDPKSETLLANLEQSLLEPSEKNEPKRKIIVFTEYADTVKHLAQKAQERFPGRVLALAGDISRFQLDTLSRNFDASVPEAEQRDDFDILIASDKLSEGFNLNRAGRIVNYDIPWNPVRVIQRVGRINRISKKVFEKLYIHNFFPTEKGAQYVQIEEIAANKMFMIHSILGEDAQIFHGDETPTPANLFKKFSEDPDEGSETFANYAYRTFLALKEKYPDVVSAVRDLPPRVKVAKRSDADELVVCVQKNDLFFRRVRTDEKGEITLDERSFQEIFPRIECERDEPRIALGALFWESYEKAKEFKETSSGGKNEMSIEVKARNAVNGFLQKETFPEYETFFEALLEDMNEYETLTQNSLRRIAKWDDTKKKNGVSVREEIESLRSDLGGDTYLDAVKRTLVNDAEKEIIVAVENRSL